MMHCQGYSNLLAEMTRYGITRKMIAEFLKQPYSTVCNKISGRSSGFTTDEAIAIKQKYFCTSDVKVLFYRPL